MILILKFEYLICRETRSSQICISCRKCVMLVTLNLLNFLNGIIHLPFLALFNIFFRDIKMRIQKLIRQQYNRAWSDCTDVQAGLALQYWWQRLICWFLCLTDTVKVIWRISCFHWWRNTSGRVEPATFSKLAERVKSIVAVLV